MINSFDVAIQVVRCLVVKFDDDKYVYGYECN